MTSETYNVVVTRTFDAPVERVWQAWSEPQLVMQWWGPTGFTCPKADLDFREGGTSLVCMRAPQEYGGGEGFRRGLQATVDWFSDPANLARYKTDRYVL